jgi:hypothetical protein
MLGGLAQRGLNKVRRNRPSCSSYVILGLIASGDIERLRNAHKKFFTAFAIFFVRTSIMEFTTATSLPYSSSTRHSWWDWHSPGFNRIIIIVQTKNNIGYIATTDLPLTRNLECRWVHGWMVNIVVDDRLLPHGTVTCRSNDHVAIKEMLLPLRFPTPTATCR